MSFTEGTKYSEALEQAIDTLLSGYDMVIDDAKKAIGAYAFFSPNDRMAEIENSKKKKLEAEKVCEALMDIMRDLEA